MSEATQPIAATGSVSPDLSAENAALCSDLLDSVTVFKARQSCRVLRKRSRGMKKLMLLAAMLMVAMLAASPALAQDEPGVMADTECKDGYIVSKAGGVVAKAPCEPEPPKAAPAPPPKAPPATAPTPYPAPAPKGLPESGGIGAPALLALGAGALLVGGGLVARRIVR